MSEIPHEKQPLYELWYLLDTMRWLRERAAGALLTVDQMPMDDDGRVMEIAESHHAWKPTINLLRRAMYQAGIMRPQDDLTPDLIRKELFNWLAVKHSLTEEDARLLPLEKAVQLLNTPPAGMGFRIEIDKKTKWMELYRIYNSLSDKWPADCSKRRAEAVSQYRSRNPRTPKSAVSGQLGNRIREQKTSSS